MSIREWFRALVAPTVYRYDTSQHAIHALSDTALEAIIGSPHAYNAEAREAADRELQARKAGAKAREAADRALQARKAGSVFDKAALVAALAALSPTDARAWAKRNGAKYGPLQLGDTMWEANGATPEAVLGIPEFSSGLKPQWRTEHGAVVIEFCHSSGSLAHRYLALRDRSTASYLAYEAWAE